MSHKRANSNVNDSSEGENDEWYNDVIEFLPSQLEGNPKGYVNYDDDVIRQEPLKKNFKLTEDNYIDEEEEEERGEGDVFIPRMTEEENDELSKILQGKMVHLRARDDTIPLSNPPQIQQRFVKPDEDNNYDITMGDRDSVTPLIFPEDDTFNADDSVFFEQLKEDVPSIRNVFVTTKAFDDAIVEIEVLFHANMLRNMELVRQADNICRALGTIVYRYIYNFYEEYPLLGDTREFKVQVGFTAIFKKLKKILIEKDDKQAVGNFEYLTFFKESMLTRNGLAIRFNSAEKSFKCTYNTTVDVINNCLDARNVPNMDSAWRYDTLKSATIKLYCYQVTIKKGGYYCALPPKIANKKACINPNTPEGCFWWCVKIGLLLNREEKIDYSRKEKDIRKEVHEVKKTHTKYQRVNNILKDCNEKGIAHYWKRDKKEKEETLRFSLNPGVKEIASIHQVDLPEDMPFDLKYYKKFCQLNPRIMLLVFAESECGSVPVQMVFEGNVSPANECVRILFLGEKGEIGHYVCIKNFNRFLHNIDKCKEHKKIWCDFCGDYKLAKSGPCKHLKLKKKIEEEDVFCCEKCMGTFESAQELQRHHHMCLIVDKNYRVVELPTERKYLEFDERHSNNLTPLPTYMVADFESILEPVEDDSSGTSKTRITANHLPCGYGINIVSVYPELRKFTTYWGTSPEDTMEKFCQDIIDISTYVYSVYNRNIPIIMTENDIDDFNTRKTCYICCQPFFKEENKYKDHDHVTGKYLGAACNACNLKRVQKNMELPLIFHNAKGYDLHHIIKEITKKKYGCTFNGIAQNSEKIMSFTIMKRYQVDDEGNASYRKTMCDIKIIDSLLFLLKSLESLTEILKKRHPDDLDKAFPILFNTMRSLGFSNQQIIVSLNKNIYPYIWLDSFGKFNLPFSVLVDLVRENRYECFTDTVDETYKSTFEKKKEVFFDVISNFKGCFNKVLDYANLYLMGDVLQLSDIVESARRTFLKTHKLDLVRYYGAPGYSWDAFLLHLKRTSGYKPNLFIATEMNMVCFFMQCIRGGCSGIMKRYARANNHLMPVCFDKTKPETYIVYLDANNLYGWSMMQNLPYKKFEWLNESWLNAVNTGGTDFIKRYFDHLREKSEGCFFEVKLEYPKELHDAHNLYPLAPERRCIKESEVSYFTRHLHDKLKVKINTKTPLLLQTLENKDHYFVYWKNLELYLNLGMKLVYVYGGIHFSEAPIMRSYIELNTKLRNQPGGSDFEKELYKLMNNSIYGKTLENPMKYSLLHFISTKKKFDKEANKPGFEGSVFSQDEFAIVKTKYETIKYDKPLYLGATVTELAKWKMFNFYYNVVQDYFKPPKKAELLFTDTDSLMMEITTDDIFSDIAAINKNPKYECPIDVSTFDKEIIEKYNIPTTNNKVIGAFKSETGSKQIAEFVGLRAKMYSYVIYGNEDSKHLRAKGVARSSLNLISHQNYIDCLFNPDDPVLARQPITMKSIRSKKHNLMSTESEKYGLSCNDTKRYIIPEGETKFVETLAFGHYAIPKYEESGKKLLLHEPSAATVVPIPAQPTQPAQPAAQTKPKEKRKRGRPIKYQLNLFNNEEN